MNKTYIIKDFTHFYDENGILLPPEKKEKLVPVIIIENNIKEVFKLIQKKRRIAVDEAILTPVLDLS